ncbi:uncharacterized protein LOC6574366 [Drosophila mojavensis]|uniref:Uncharacterized protein, isoform A n=1 Tax=Drosophila mojavensis TaxID=7230 RepID=B4KCM9_DROMO|nr:uncharacterized protein LOC6574366 [Drosophila mojavensis]XP_015022904.1 uncharacterized protein LOC6574366 [Drosophila mojavensis]XP_043864338.1 uncharacterized protein LOC6574366 [Drosophila mojavensis]XP_043864339.1 uncharacterized protein LOC6574366 [Drosophila mojavensis]EDW15878.1 uncharacterized protein Dmoj_GI22538, isoform A [Drosophila mojavensis]KRG01795.1 uncharacterized protein Dmoj_GI22538, isoform B [Drosophila mojavensis]KRG01796.1 uncharacterized protein Dmoj_GI22538, isof
MRCRRAARGATAAAGGGGEGGEGRAGERAIAGEKVLGKLAGRRASRFSPPSGVWGAGTVLLAFLAAVSFRGMHNPLAASATTLGDNSSLIAATNGATEAATAATALPGNQLGIEPESSTTEQQAADTWSERPDTATLTKGFSIPTYLPPFPDFIAADLPQTSLTTMTTSAQLGHNPIPAGLDIDDMDSMQSTLNKQQPQSQPQPHMRLHAYDSEQKEQQLRREKELAREREQLPRRHLSLPSRNVTVQAGQHAYLPCQLHQYSNKPLSWIRLRDEHIIAVDHTTFINDARFAALLQASHANLTSSLMEFVNGSSGSSNSLGWTLLIKYVNLQDMGWYECQLATEPKMSAKVQLFVITPKTELIGDKQRFVKAGSRVELHCIVRGTLEAPKYIVWYREKQQVMSENEASGNENGWYTQIDRNIFGSTEHNRNTIGSLIIPIVRKSHSGNYTCEPENSEAVSIQLHVLSGEYSASAIMSAAAGLYKHGHVYNSFHQWLIFLLLAIHKT